MMEHKDIARNNFDGTDFRGVVSIALGHDFTQFWAFITGADSL